MKTLWSSPDSLYPEITAEAHCVNKGIVTVTVRKTKPDGGFKAITKAFFASHHPILSINIADMARVYAIATELSDRLVAEG